VIKLVDFGEVEYLSMDSIIENPKADEKCHER